MFDDSENIDIKNMVNNKNCNKSFLHKNNSDKFEGLALKKTKLSLQLVPTDIEIEKVFSIDEHDDQDQPTQLSKEYIEEHKNSNITVENVIKENNICEKNKETGGKNKEIKYEKEKGVPVNLNDVVDNHANKEAIDILQDDKNCNINILNKFESPNNQIKERTTCSNFKTQPNWGFTNIFNTSEPKKKPKKIRSDTIDRQNSISSITEFIYTKNNNLNNTKLLLLNKENNNDSIKPSFLEKYKITISKNENSTVNNIDKKIIIIDDNSLQQSKLNQSFLWTHLQKESGILKKNNNDIKNDDLENYDDVENFQINDDVYDDIALSSTIGRISSSTIDYTDDEFEVYDDVMTPSNQNEKTSSNKNQIDEKNINLNKRESNNNISLKDFEFPDDNDNEIITNNNNYSTIIDDNDNYNDPIYDDIIYNNNSMKIESRVNSIYAGGSFISEEINFIYANDSDWEDVDDSNDDLTKNHSPTGAKHDSLNTQFKKKNRRTRKNRNLLKSKGSRKNSVRSGKLIIRRRSTISVAVSLGTGSILLVGIATNGTDESWRDITTSSSTTTTTTDDDTTTINKSSTSSCYASFDDNIKTDKSCNNFTHGLVQMRTLEHDEASMDTQETSCYVLEDTSDDSNYETVEIELLQSDNSIQEKVDDTINNSNDDSINNSSLEIKPITLPPRESSLTETLGKRMKMLRRTWSMTKVSLGRMRKKTMNDNDNITNDYTINDNIKLKTSQVFNLKKHFQRSLSSKSSLSKFYLDNDYVDDMTNLKNNNFYSNEEIYESNNWFNRSGSWKNNSLRKREESCSDDYNLLAEEPLYQYYAAAKVHGEFQINSDDYDEDDDDDEDDYSTSLPQTLDMGTLAHRTLWCETSQVLQSDILDNLTSEEKKIQEAKFEIITSEASYLNSLRVLVTEFMINHKLVHEDLSPLERDKLFGQVPNVLIASENFLSELEKIWNNDIMLNGLPQIILQHADKCCKNYIDYCSNQVYIDTTLKNLKIKKNSTFIDNVMKIESHPACQSLSLHSFLMLPLQRITRLPLLADAVLSKLSTDHVEREDWEKVLAVLGKIVRDCNEAARNTGRIVDIENLSKKLEYSSKIIPIDLSGRYLVRSGCVKTILSKTGTDYVLTFRKKYQKTILHIFLLNDYILITKIKTNDCYIVIDACKRCLIELEKVQDETQFTGKYSLILTLLENHCGKHVEYILSCDNQTERERWLDAMSQPKSNLVGETLYETWDCPQVVTLHSYSPNQPDELSFQPGEVIKVLRKLPDGWYEGEKIVGDEKGWFPGNYTKEVPSEHVRAKHLRQQHRFLALSHAFTQQLNNPNR